MSCSLLPFLLVLSAATAWANYTSSSLEKSWLGNPDWAERPCASSAWNRIRFEPLGELLVEEDNGPGYLSYFEFKPLNGSAALTSSRKFQIEPLAFLLRHPLWPCASEEGVLLDRYRKKIQNTLDEESATVRRWQGWLGQRVENKNAKSQSIDSGIADYDDETTAFHVVSYAGRVLAGEEDDHQVDLLVPPLARHLRALYTLATDRSYLRLADEEYVHDYAINNFNMMMLEVGQQEELEEEKGRRPPLYLIDIGGGYYDTGDGGSSTKWLLEKYRRLGVQFDEVFVFEKRRLDPERYREQVVEHVKEVLVPESGEDEELLSMITTLRSRNEEGTQFILDLSSLARLPYSRITVLSAFTMPSLPVEQDETRSDEAADGMVIWQLCRAPNGVCVLKLDIDDPEVEHALLDAILGAVENEGTATSLNILELFWEPHTHVLFNPNLMSMHLEQLVLNRRDREVLLGGHLPSFAKHTRTVSTARIGDFQTPYRYLHSLRKAGVRAHGWI
ncbi:unnamed protein product [Amoebophrya sp. A25]|nr:unnamed protein product [Amoebophrya sp. A25]|eukprot:GSA25T00008518001.1